MELIIGWSGSFWNSPSLLNACECWWFWSCLEIGLEFLNCYFLLRMICTCMALWFCRFYTIKQNLWWCRAVVKIFFIDLQFWGVIRWDSCSSAWFEEVWCLLCMGVLVRVQSLNISCVIAWWFPRLWCSLWTWLENWIWTWFGVWFMLSMWLFSLRYQSCF